MKIKFCPLCGRPFEIAYESAEELRSSYDICDCCGCEYGYDDNESHYNKWVAEGCKWFEPKSKPNGWILTDQTKNQIRSWPPL